jgi:outer membrane protein assembly factor BamD (BamD/ComL family)
MRRHPNSQRWTSVIGFLVAFACISFLHLGTRADEVSRPSNVSGVAQKSPKQPDPAEALLQSGNDRHAAGDLRQAEKKWLEIRNGGPTSRAWPKAVFNLGMLEREKANYPAAVSYFNDVLQSFPFDEEPGADIMQGYRNYSNRSAVQISVC